MNMISKMYLWIVHQIVSANPADLASVAIVSENYGLLTSWF